MRQRKGGRVEDLGLAGRGEGTGGKKKRKRRRKGRKGKKGREERGGERGEGRGRRETRDERLQDQDSGAATVMGAEPRRSLIWPISPRHCCFSMRKRKRTVTVVLLYDYGAYSIAPGSKHLSYSHTLILSCSHALMLSYSHTLTLSHSHTLILSLSPSP